MSNGVAFTIRFRDRKQNTSNARYWAVFNDVGNSLDANVEPVRAASAALSNATVTSSTQRATTNVAGAAGEYDTVEDKAIITFQTASGALHRYSIAAPKSSMFQADQETVDFSVGAVSTYTAAVIANCVGRGGEALTAVVGGIRHRSPMIRRANIFTRNPALTGQGL